MSIIEIIIAKNGGERSVASSRDSLNTTRHSIPFEFVVKMPAPLYARRILERDEVWEDCEVRGLMIYIVSKGGA